MRKAAAVVLKEGDILSRDIITSEGKLLLKKGLSLSKSHIEGIVKMGIPHVYLRNLDLDIDINLEENELILVNIRWELNELARSVFAYYSTYKTIDMIHVKKVVSIIIEELTNRDNQMIQLSNLSNYKDYPSLHAVNSCILAVALGMAMGYNPLELQDLAAGVLLQDIGMLEIPEEIINQPKLCSTEDFTRIQRHPSFSYDILSQCKEIGMLASITALQHHERFDGTGYPRGLKGSDISSYAFVASIVDVYDALTADRPHRKRMLPHETYEYFAAYGGTAFDLKTSKVFLSKLILYPNGTLVKLSNGGRGIVLRQNLYFPSRPVILITGADGKTDGRRIKYRELDLLKVMNIMILGVVED